MLFFFKFYLSNSFFETLLIPFIFFSPITLLMLDSSIGRYETALWEKKEVLKYFWIKQPDKRNTRLPLLLCTNRVSVYHPELYSTQNVLGAGLMASHFLLQSRPGLVLRKKDSWADWRIRNSVGAQGVTTFVEEVEIISKPQMERGTAQKKKKHPASESPWSQTAPWDSSLWLSDDLSIS